MSVATIMQLHHALIRAAIFCIPPEDLRKHFIVFSNYLKEKNQKFSHTRRILLPFNSQIFFISYLFQNQRPIQCFGSRLQLGPTLDHR